jgi:hypothetical protein
MKEQLHYFAYGSIYGHELRFHKRGRDGSGKCDAFQVDKRNARVIGALFSLPQDGKAELDRIEGLGGGYEQKMVSVASYSRAMTYYATDIGETLVPYCWYRQHVLAGAREFALPDDYIEAIASVPINRDTNQARWEKELSLYT